MNEFKKAIKINLKYCTPIKLFYINKEFYIEEEYYYIQTFKNSKKNKRLSKI